MYILIWALQAERKQLQNGENDGHKNKYTTFKTPL